MTYDAPGRTGVDMKAGATVRLAHNCENIVDIKGVTGSLEQVDEIIRDKPDRFDVIGRDDTLTFSMITSDAADVISTIGNTLPKELSGMIRLEPRGECETA